MINMKLFCKVLFHFSVLCVSLEPLLGMDSLSFIFLFPIFQHLKNKLVLSQPVSS